MNNTEEALNKIYEEIGKLIWSMFLEDAIEAYFYAQVYDTSSESQFHWVLKNGEESWHEFETAPYEIYNKTVEQLKKLQKHKLFKKEPWTQCRVVLSDQGEFNIKFAYVPWEDSWPGLYMKGVNEISYEEAREHCNIPKEEWEKRQKFKK